MAKLYIICGHGAGDPGAVGNGFTEAERVRALGRRIAELGGADVCLLDTSRNWYADNGIMSLSVPDDACLVELHMDAGAAGARGGHVIICAGVGGADGYDAALADLMREVFPGRSVLVSERSDLANPNRAAARGINYRLVENGFITDPGDVATFNFRLDDIARGYLAAFGINCEQEKEPVMCVWQCNPNLTDAQLWRVEDPGRGDGSVKIVNKAGGVLDVKGGTDAGGDFAGRDVQVHDDNGTPAQAFKLLPGVDDGSIQIASCLDEGQVLDVDHGTVGERQYVHLHEVQEGERDRWAQSWRLVPYWADPSWRCIVNAKSLMLLDANPKNQ